MRVPLQRKFSQVCQGLESALRRNLPRHAVTAQNLRNFQIQKVWGME